MSARGRQSTPKSVVSCSPIWGRCRGHEGMPSTSRCPPTASQRSSWGLRRGTSGNRGERCCEPVDAKRRRSQRHCVTASGHPRAGATEAPLEHALHCKRRGGLDELDLIYCAEHLCTDIAESADVSSPALGVLLFARRVFISFRPFRRKSNHHHHSSRRLSFFYIFLSSKSTKLLSSPPTTLSHVAAAVPHCPTAQRQPVALHAVHGPRGRR